MGSCIICGTDVPGEVCESHEEDVYFEFAGTAPSELTVGRYYRGTVDGFADFGVFIDIGDEVTGLLHTSELDRRLEGLDWEPGDTIFVQVKNVRDNGNVDLGWSIRQRPREFRGGLIDDGESERPLTERADDAASSRASPTPSRDATDDQTATAGTEPPTQRDRGSGDPQSVQREESASVGIGDGPAVETRMEREPVTALSEQVGNVVLVEGEITRINQTNGPTVFELTDETGSIECPAFESAGVRAYPEIEHGDVVRIRGEVEERRGVVQVETSEITVLTGDGKDEVLDRIDAALTERAAPSTDELLVTVPGIDAIRDDLVSAATRIRRAVFDRQPIVVRHSATVDGYVAGVAIERAVLSLLESEHEEQDAVYQYFDRRPLEDRIYGMQDAMRDTTRLISDQDRYDEQPPLLVYANTASTDESRDSLSLLGLYGADRVVIDCDYPGEIGEETELLVAPTPERGSTEADALTTAVICSNIAVLIDESVRVDLQHLPAVSYWQDGPEVIRGIADSAGYDDAAIDALRKAIAIEAFYQSYEDKRELITDLLFNDHPLVSHASSQYDERVSGEIRTAKPHLEERTVDGYSIGVLDTAAFTHQYDFPPVRILLAELATAEPELDAIVGIGEDEFIVWSEESIDMRAVGDVLTDAVPDGGVETRGGRDGTVQFLHGARDSVTEASANAVARALA